MHRHCHIVAVLPILLGACGSAPRSPAAPAIAASTKANSTTNGLATLDVTGLPKARQLDVAALEALGAEDLTWAHHAETHVYRCTSLFAVLTNCGLEPGTGGPGADPRSKHGGWRRVVRATASDGFDAIFSSAELSPDLGPSRVLVAWAVDGEPLGASEGPLRLLVPTDKKGSRSIRGLVRVDVSESPR